MTNAKVKVSKEVAETLDDILAYYKPVDIVATSARNGWEERGAKNFGFLNARHLDLDTLIKAVYFGYEIEQTPADKVAEYYLMSVGQANSAYRKGIKDDIEFVTKAYGLKIEGVNA